MCRSSAQHSPSESTVQCLCKKCGTTPFAIYISVRGGILFNWSWLRLTLPIHYSLLGTRGVVDVPNFVVRPGSNLRFVFGPTLNYLSSEMFFTKILTKNIFFVMLPVLTLRVQDCCSIVEIRSVVCHTGISALRSPHCACLICSNKGLRNFEAFQGNEKNWPWYHGHENCTASRKPWSEQEVERCSYWCTSRTTKEKFQ